MCWSGLQAKLVCGVAVLGSAVAMAAQATVKRVTLPGFTACQAGSCVVQMASVVTGGHDVSPGVEQAKAPPFERGSWHGVHVMQPKHPPEGYVATVVYPASSSKGQGRSPLPLPG